MKAIQRNKRKLKKELIYQAPSWVLGVFCILIFYPPFFRGLFFQKELLVTHLFTFLLITIWLYIKIKSDSPIFQSIPDLLALGVVFLYFISTFYGVNTRLAIAEFMKYANYLGVYLLARDLSRDNDRNRNIILNVLLGSGVIVAFIGIGSAIGTFDYNGAFTGERISSTFQYPNALAAYLCALLILTLGFLENSQSLKTKSIYGALANLMLFTFIPTFSRGMWLLAPIALIIYIILIPKDKRLAMLADGFSVLAPAAICSFAFIKSLEGTNAFLKWGILLISIVLAIGLLILRHRFLDITAKENKRRILMAGGTVIFLAAIMAGIAFTAVAPLTFSNMGLEEDTSKSVSRDIAKLKKDKEYILKTDIQAENPQEKPYAGRIDIYSIDEEGKSERLAIHTADQSEQAELNFTIPDNAEFIRLQFSSYYTDTKATFDKASIYNGQTGERLKDIKLKYKYLPERVISRFHSISIKERSAQSRTLFYKDAFKIIKDYPILGAGGGGWETLYFMYQSSMYWSTQAHNYFMQMWIEIGTLGILIFIAFVLIMLREVWRTQRDIESNDKKLMQITISMAWLTLLVHSAMDFDLSLGALSIVLWTLVGTTIQSNTVSDRWRIKNQKIRYLFILIPIILFMGAGSLHLAQQQAKQSVDEAQSGSIYQAIEHMEDATKLDPFTASYKIDLASMYGVVGTQDDSYIKKALQTVEKTIKQSPYDAKLLKKAGEICIQVGEFEKGLAYMQEAITVQPMNENNYMEQAHAYIFVSKGWIENNQMENFYKHIDKMKNIKIALKEMNERSLEPVSYNKELNNTFQQLDYLLDNKKDVEKLKQLDKVALYQKFDLDLDKNEMPDGTFISNADGGDIEVKMDKKGVVLNNPGQNYGVFWIHDFQLTPGKEYTIAFEYKSTVKSQNANLYLYDYSQEQTRTFANFAAIDPSADFTKAEMHFKVPSDAVAEKQRIGIIHRGNDPGAIYIKNVSIVER